MPYVSQTYIDGLIDDCVQKDAQIERLSTDLDAALASLTTIRQQARREALEEAARKAALIGATCQIDTAPAEYTSGYQDAAESIRNAIRALIEKEGGDSA